jgi:hypothetical protein
MVRRILRKQRHRTHRAARLPALHGFPDQARSDLRGPRNGMAMVEAMIIIAPANTYIQNEIGFADISPAPIVA